nr:ABC transporter substrate-binding protein [uncultured Desulfobacter sp.]
MQKTTFRAKRYTIAVIFTLGFVLTLVLMPHNARAVTATDFSGRTIDLKRPARHVVCLIESALTGIYMLGAQDQVTGVSAQVYQKGIFKYYEAMDDRIARRSLPDPGSWDHVNMESLVALSPDLVIIWADQAQETAEISGKGIPVYGVSLSSIPDVLKEIRDLGVLLGKQDRADQLLAFANQEVNKLSRTHPDSSPKPGVYFIWSQGILDSSGSPSTVDDMITLAGGRNVCGDMPMEHTVISQEKLLGLKPDIIVMWPNPRLSPEQIMGHPLWRHLPASKNRRVFELPSAFYCDLWTLKCLYVISRIHAICQPYSARQFDEKKERSRIMNALYGNALGNRLNFE